jgi:uncharacterized protein YukE
MVETIQYLPSEMKENASRFSQYTLQIRTGSKSHEMALDDELISY